MPICIERSFFYFELLVKEFQSFLHVLTHINVFFWPERQLHSKIFGSNLFGFLMKNEQQEMNDFSMQVKNWKNYVLKDLYFELPEKNI